ncbi:YdiU family protein [Aestuariibius sp. HNIBRBA575]|uniref:protein adenylyltransferase SelO n=1 Tax=Aestuariibius sp. HNIBRBA575 TaxID=3233343 RepID=UPI0034A412D8
MAIKIPFDNSYTRLPDQMYSHQVPEPVSNPSLIIWNAELATQLGITQDTESDLAQVFSGNIIPNGATPIAQAYAGHQFGHWNPQLGDGRAVLLGEVNGPAGRFDLQLKGSGRTPYSRNGDGRAWLGPVLREYLMSEAMFALSVPTTRALAAVATGDRVQREIGYPGGIVTRIAASHIRIGTFQYFAARNELVALRALYDHVIERHYPDATSPSDLLKQIMTRQAQLIAGWMSVGFIHGVMNTDNAQIAGETIDYGPCAFMDDYHAMQVFSSIDQRGRYAYGNQPRIAVWNIAQLATALIPLMPDQDRAIEDFTEIVNGFPAIYETEWRKRFAAKLGIAPSEASDQLAQDLLALMDKDAADFTNVFANLGRDTDRDQFIDRAVFDAWRVRWMDQVPNLDQMRITNPIVVPRLHQIEAVIQAAVEGDYTPFHTLLSVVTHPFDRSDLADGFTQPPVPSEVVSRTFCGT